MTEESQDAPNDKTPDESQDATGDKKTHEEGGDATGSKQTEDKKTAERQDAHIGDTTDEESGDANNYTLKRTEEVGDLSSIGKSTNEGSKDVNNAPPSSPIPSSEEESTEPDHYHYDPHLPPPNEPPKLKRCCSIVWKRCCCWYSCLLCMIPFIMIALAFFIIEILALVHYLLSPLVNPEGWILAMLSTSLTFHLFFFFLCQLIVILVLYETLGCCDIILFVVCFTITLFMAALTLVFSFVCDQFCISTHEVIDLYVVVLNNLHFKIAQLLRWISLLDILLMLLLLHLYLHFRCQFAREKREIAYKKAEEARKKLQKLIEMGLIPPPPPKPATPPNKKQSSKKKKSKLRKKQKKDEPEPKDKKRNAPFITFTYINA